MDTEGAVVTDISDAVSRLQHLNDTLAENDRLRAEIATLRERLRQKFFDSLRLTDDEREAVEWAIMGVPVLSSENEDLLAALRGLLERTK